MAPKPPIKESPPTILQDVLHQTMLQQAEDDQIDLEGATTQDDILHPSELTTSDMVNGEVPPPPAYGDIYGEVGNEKDGLGTRARVTDDGRVEIRVNQLNRRLSQVFTPALRQHVQSAQDDCPPPPLPYISPALGGQEGVSPPPSLNVVIQVVGSRGDVQPFVALGKVLKESYGHRVRLATHPTFKAFVEENGLEFYGIGGDPSRLMAFMVRNPGLMPGFRSLVSGDVGERRKDVGEYIQGCWRSCYKAGNGMHLPSSKDKTPEIEAKPFVADCIIANPPSFAHIHCAEKLGIPVHLMFTMPWSPTQKLPHPLANIKSSNADPQLTNYISYTMIELLTWQGVGDIINRFRVKCLGLDPITQFSALGMLQRLRIPHTYCWSPALIAKPQDWASHISIAGFYFLKSPNYTPAPDLKAFLDAGPPPVYIGFGSIVLNDSNAMTELIFEVVRKTGQRVLLSKGWGGLGAEEMGTDVPDGVFMLGNVPHDWLFKQVRCVVHHGGAGTTAAGIAAGRPTVIVPFFGDQPFWGAMVARAGAGPNPIPHKHLTAERLAEAINFCLKPESMERANELARKIAAERGSDKGAQSFHQYLEVDRLRCTLVPSRAATWRIKRTNIRLSAFAACTLANANLLELDDLKLFRPQEYETETGPWDPISGGFMAAVGAFSDMGKGIFEIPTETYKAAKLPFKQSRQQSKASEPTLPASHKSPSVDENMSPDNSSKGGQTGLNADDKLTHDSLKASRRPSSTSQVTSISTYNSSQLKSSSGNASIYGTQLSSQMDTGSDKDYDMLRHNGAHGSKGLGRSVTALVQSPVDLSMSITNGFRNMPRYWGDRNLRPAPRINGFASGVKVAGKEFGLGMYDSVTGLVTQPWKGAQRDGVVGGFAGFGKGLGGFFTKMSAGTFGILGYSLKGVHKEVLKLFGGNFHSYIVASRTAQGYEEWLQSSEAERQDVIDQWMLIQKYLKKRKGKNNNEMVGEILDAHRKKSVPDNQIRPSNSTHSASGDDDVPDSESTMLAMGNPHPSLPEKPRGSANVDGNRDLTVPESMSSARRLLRKPVNRQADREDLHQAMPATGAPVQSGVSESEKYKERFQREDRSEQTQSSSDGEWESDMSLGG